MHIVTLITFLLYPPLVLNKPSYFIDLGNKPNKIVDKMIIVTLTVIVCWKYSMWNLIENNKFTQIYTETKFNLQVQPLPFYYRYGHWLNKSNQSIGETTVVIFINEKT